MPACQRRQFEVFRPQFIVLYAILSGFLLAGCGSAAQYSSGTGGSSGPSGPSPTITAISPNSAVAGGAPFTLQIIGTNFVIGSTTVYFGALVISDVSGGSTELLVNVPAAAIASAGTVAVTVTNPAPGGGTSNAVNFAINSPLLGTFATTGSMATPRSFHTATLLPDGRVLIAGGTISLAGGTTSPTAELYIPSEHTFISTGMMTTARSGHTATLLGDGRVLITGGSSDTTTAELYDPATGTFTATGEAHQFGGTATLLHSGQVLIAGGVIDPTATTPTVAIPELYDPTTGTFTATGPFADTSYSDGYDSGGPAVSSASLLPDGRVLIAAEPAAELYDPASGTFSLTGAMTTPCFGGKPPYIDGLTASVLLNGAVLVAGGVNEDFGWCANGELYDSGSGTFTATGNMTRARDNHTATLLPDGTVLIAGGESDNCIPFEAGLECTYSGTTASAELYVPSTGTFVADGEMTAQRGGQSATLLNDGTVLITGGYCSAGIGQPCGTFASAELYTPAHSGP